jgi:hypothetical protein
MTDRPTLRVLDDLGAELDRVAAEAAAPAAAAARRPLPLRRALVLAAAAVLVAAGLAVAASLVVTGEPIPSARDRDVPPEATPEPGTARVTAVRAEDPDARAPDWTVRLSRSRTGQLCAAVGQVVDDRFGLVGLDGRFRTLPPLGVDACADPAGDPPAMIGARMFAGDRPSDVRTVVYGVGGDDLRAVTVRDARGERPVEVGDGGVFAAAYRGYVEDVQPRVELEFEDGGTRTFPFGVIGGPSAPDPESGPPWIADDASRPGRTCTQVRRARGRTTVGMAITYPVCGDLPRDHVFFEVAPFPRRQDHDAPRLAYPWGQAPARTLVWGAADHTVASIEVRPDGGEPVPVDLSAPEPSFVGVFPAGTEPESLEVAVRFRDGTEHTFRGGQNLRDSEGRPSPSDFRREVLEAVPGPRPQAPPAPGAPPRPADSFRHDASTVRLGSRAGGWAVRSWRAKALGTGVRLRCAQLGRLEGGRFVLPEGGRELGERGASCAPVDERQAPYRTETFLDDPLAYAPRPTRTVVWGAAGPGARRVTLGGPWGRRDVRPGTGGTFLLVLSPQPGLDRRGVHLLVTYADGERTSSRNPGFRPARVVPGSVFVETRAPDPEGLQPWAVQHWRTRDGESCRQEGRVVGERVGFVDHDRGTFAPYPMHEGGPCSRFSRTRLPDDNPVGLSVASGGPDPFGDGPALRAARARRRTLPGTTTILGTARPDVERVTFRTQRDVRTLRPTRSGLVLLVYDGEFLGGATIGYTAHLRDGRRVTREMPLSP